MKAITILQPWASLVATGKKRCETRSWQTRYRGELLIHAGKSPYSQIEKMIPAKDRKRIREVLDLGKLGWKEKVPAGVLVGMVNLVNCVRITEEIRDLIREQEPDEYAFGDFTPGRYAWIMTDPVWFKDPIPAKGKQRLWEWEGELPWK